ncbi:MAG: phosphatase PAP2 family protein [Promethearchaeota archaeon]
MIQNRKFIMQITVVIICIFLIAIVLLIPTFFDFTWNKALRDLLPGAKYFFRYITELGGTLIYLGAFFIIFWGINKNIAKIIGLVYVTSNFVNYYGKAIIGNERPPESNWLLISPSYFSTPSGHAMSSTVFWGITSMKFKKVAMWVIYIILIILIGLSRVYLGVHWIGDIFTGWLFGVIILFSVWIFQEPISSFVSKYNIFYVYLGLAIFGFVVLILTEIFYGAKHNFGGPGGQMIGLGLGFALEHKYINFEIKPTSGKKWKIILRIIIGILILIIVFLGFDLVFDTDIVWLKAIRYVIALLTGIVIWPFIFEKIDL